MNRVIWFKILNYKHLNYLLLKNTHFNQSLKIILLEIRKTWYENNKKCSSSVMINEDWVIPDIWFNIMTEYSYTDTGTMSENGGVTFGKMPEGSMLL